MQLENVGLLQIWGVALAVKWIKHRLVANWQNSEEKGNCSNLHLSISPSLRRNFMKNRVYKF